MGFSAQIFTAWLQEIFLTLESKVSALNQIGLYPDKDQSIKPKRSHAKKPPQQCLLTGQAAVNYLCTGKVLAFFLPTEDHYSII